VTGLVGRERSCEAPLDKERPDKERPDNERPDDELEEKTGCASGC